MNESIKKNGITFGVLSGALSVLVTTLIYTLDIKLFLSFWITFIKVGLFVTLMILLLNKTKKDVNGVFTFKDAFTTYFIATLVGVIITTLFEIVLFNYVDPSLKESIKEMSLDFSVKLMQKMGATASDINKTIIEIKKADQFSVAQLIKGTFIYVLFSSIFGLILAAFFKTNTSID